MDYVHHRMATVAEPDGLAEVVAGLAAHASLEVTPRQAVRMPDLAELLGAGTEVYLPYLPGSDFAETASASRCLRNAGLCPVPHLPARAVPSAGALDEWLAALAESGADSLLLIAGDLSSVSGPYGDTLGLLETGKLAEYGFRRIGVAGHPEGSPYADKAGLDAALDLKLAYARETGTEVWIVTQFLFTAQPAIQWLRHVRDRGVELPIRIGIPGPARLKTLLVYAARCGVSVSARVLKQRPGAARLFGTWTPDTLVSALARHRMEEGGVAADGLHVFPFGGIAEAAAWLGILRNAAGPDPADSHDQG